MAVQNCMEKLNITADKFEQMAPPDGSNEDGACFTGCILVAIGFVSYIRERERKISAPCLNIWEFDSKIMKIFK